MDKCAEKWAEELAKAGFDTVTVDEFDRLGERAADDEILDTATETNRILVTSDTDFAAPHRADHAGIVLIPNDSRGREEARRAVEQIVSAYPDLSGEVEFVGNWL